MKKCLPFITCTLVWIPLLGFNQMASAQEPPQAPAASPPPAPPATVAAPDPAAPHQPNGAESAPVATTPVAPAPAVHPPAVHPHQSAAQAPKTAKAVTNASAPILGEQGSVRDSAAEDTARTTPKPGEDGFQDSFIVSPRRIYPYAPKRDFATFSLHGEYEMRFRVLSDLRLERSVRDVGAEAKLLGQNAYLYHWLRLRPRVDIDNIATIVGQIDIPRGLIAGDTTRDVTSARDSLAEPNWFEIHPRELFVEFRTEVGVIRVGQQLSHWGLGLLANDGDRPQMFGDSQRGSIAERFLFATKPFGKESPFVVAAAADMVFEDATADLLEDNFAAQGVLAALLQGDTAELGVYGIARHQWRPRDQFSAIPFTEKLTVGVVDAYGRYRSRVRGSNWYLQGAAEAAILFGSTDFIRTAYNTPLDPTAERPDEGIVAFGTAVVLSLVRGAQTGQSTNPAADAMLRAKHAPRRFGDMAFELEWGYASGDANPYDGTQNRFAMDQNHNVGLILFDHVMAWKTARAATIAQDPRVLNRPPPGIDRLPTNGSVFGATYLNPRAVVRPKEWIDVKLGFVFAQAAADLVDPYHAGALGSIRNYDGGDPNARDLGIEIDTGFDFRIPLSPSINVNAGAEGGIFFPGHAFDDKNGTSLPTQYLLNTKLGLAF